MSEMAKNARRAMQEKAERLVSNDPRKKVDASSWEPTDSLQAGRKTGARPVRARIYKHGGHVQGDRGPRRLDRRPRADGGVPVRTIPEGVSGLPPRDTPTPRIVKLDPDSGYFGSGSSQRPTPRYEGEERKKGGRAKRADGGSTGGSGALSMRDTAGANKKALGSYHDGGYKKGGRAKRDMGGMTDPRDVANQALMAGSARAGVPVNRMAPSMSRPSMMLHKGGKADERQDKAEVREGVHKHERHLHKNEPLTQLKRGGHLSAKARQKLPKGDFGLPGKGAGPGGKGAGSYPMPDEGHARAALARSKANASPAQQATIKRKVEEKYPGMEVKCGGGRVGHARGGAPNGKGNQAYTGGTRPTGGRIVEAHGGEREPRAKGGRAKGKTNINIVIAQPQPKPPMMPPQGPVRPPMAPPPMPVGGPPPAAMGPPPGMGGGLGMPPPGGMVPPPMQRARGGAANAESIPLKHAGAGGGEGRLEKIQIQKRSRRERGGSTFHPHAGAGSGEGRLEKANFQARHSR